MAKPVLTENDLDRINMYLFDASEDQFNGNVNEFFEVVNDILKPEQIEITAPLLLETEEECEVIREIAASENGEPLYLYFACAYGKRTEEDENQLSALVTHVEIVNKKELSDIMMFIPVDGDDIKHDSDDDISDTGKSEDGHIKGGSTS